MVLTVYLLLSIFMAYDTVTKQGCFSRQSQSGTASGDSFIGQSIYDCYLHISEVKQLCDRSILVLNLVQSYLLRTHSHPMSYPHKHPLCVLPTKELSKHTQDVQGNFTVSVYLHPDS